MTATPLLLATLLACAGSPSIGRVEDVHVRSSDDATEVVVSIEGPYSPVVREGADGRSLVVELHGVCRGITPRRWSGLVLGGVVALHVEEPSDTVLHLVVGLDRMRSFAVETRPDALVLRLEGPGGDFGAWRWSTEAAVAVASAADSAVAVVPDPVRAAASAQPASVPDPGPGPRRVTVEFSGASIRDVLLFFGNFTGHSFVAGSGVSGTVDARIVNQPWPDALDAILDAHGLVALDTGDGIIRVDDAASRGRREEVAPLSTRAYRINYASPDELRPVIEGLLSPRGRVAGADASNALVVTDLDRVHADVAALIRELDVRTPQVRIEARLVFVNRTGLDELGIAYDLKDRGGNQLNGLVPGGTDLDGDGTISFPEERFAPGEPVVSLSGPSVAALGNATARVPTPALRVLASLVAGRHTLVGFVEALTSRQLGEIEAAPSVTVRNHREASIQVGERTPLRVIDAAGIGARGATGQGTPGGMATVPQATVRIEETGIILRATPHVTDDGHILLELRAERSAPQLADSDVGFVFTTQNASSEVLVRDGGTVVIGGLTVTESSRVTTGIPLLMDIPLLGWLFRTRRDQSIRRDLVILVTPTIVDDDEAGSPAGTGRTW